MWLEISERYKKIHFGILRYDVDIERVLRRTLHKDTMPKKINIISS